MVLHQSSSYYYSGVQVLYQVLGYCFMCPGVSGVSGVGVLFQVSGCCFRC